MTRLRLSQGGWLKHSEAAIVNYRCATECHGWERLHLFLAVELNSGLEQRPLSQGDSNIKKKITVNTNGNKPVGWESSEADYLPIQPNGVRMYQAEHHLEPHDLSVIQVYIYTSSSTK